MLIAARQRAQGMVAHEQVWPRVSSGGGARTLTLAPPSQRRTYHPHVVNSGTRIGVERGHAGHRGHLGRLARAPCDTARVCERFGPRCAPPGAVPWVCRAHRPPPPAHAYMVDESQKATDDSAPKDDEGVVDTPATHDRDQCRECGRGGRSGRDPVRRALQCSVARYHVGQSRACVAPSLARDAGRTGSQWRRQPGGSEASSAIARGLATGPTRADSRSAHAACARPTPGPQDRSRTGRPDACTRRRGPDHWQLGLAQGTARALRPPKDETAHRPM